jgi:predicted lipoprotein with Yx(FWY)xxD motif
MRRAAVIVAILALTASGAQAGRTGGTIVKAAVNSHLKAAILVNAAGRTLYLYTADTGGQSNCVDDVTYHCSKHWPPLLTTSAPHAGPGAVQSLLGTITRPNGSLQVTYRGHPLYTWVGGYGGAGDKKSGDVNGQNFLGLWWVLSPTGAAVHKKPK